jgi:uncharacterized protein (DUF1501 family)
MPNPLARQCPGVPRRTFLQVGGLALGGLALPQLLRAEERSGVRTPHKSVIMVFLPGGPPHQDTVDLKPDAPAEFRGEFRPIRTNVPGLNICEHLPRLARMMDRFAVIRSLVGSDGFHVSYQCVTGHSMVNQPTGGWPSFGSAVSKLQGAAGASVPAFVGLAPKMKATDWANPGQPGFLGRAYAPLTPNADGLANMALRGMSVERFDDRKALLRTFDTLRRDLDATGALEGADVATRRALDILTSAELPDALDLTKEDPRVRDRYGRGSPEPAGYGDAAPLLNDYFLAARRLVEVGVRVVTLAYGRWDWHGRPHGTIFENARHHLPMLDRGLSALVEDLHERGLDKDVSVVVWGEFGRNPQINKEAGRDHWPGVGCALLAGGGMRTGQVIGATDRLGGRVVDRPVHFQEVFATLYHNLGIDVTSTTLKDHSGRPYYLVEADKKPIRELV